VYRTILFSVAFPFVLVIGTASGIYAADEYPVHPDSVSQNGVPQGEIKGPFEWHSEIFPVRRFKASMFDDRPGRARQG
jgi:hypothetical protein